jgi:uncharacterized protein (DUF3084 family)
MVQAEKTTALARVEAEVKKLRQEATDKDTFARQMADKLSRLEAEATTHEEALARMRTANADLESTVAMLQQSNSSACAPARRACALALTPPLPVQVCASGVRQTHRPAMHAPTLRWSG